MTDTLERPNADALTAANADPVAFAERLAVLPWLTERLNEWPDPWDDDGERIPPTVGGGARVHPAWLASSAATSLAQLRHDWTGTLRNPEGFRRSAAGNAVEKLADLPEAPDSGSGLSLLAAAAERLPPQALADTRAEVIVPVVTVTEAPERDAGRLAFGGLMDVGDPPPGQLPLFPATFGPRVPLLELCDAYGVPTMAQGRGAPLELGTYVGALSLTPYELRAAEGRIVTTVREFRDFLFGETWKPNERRYRHRTSREWQTRPGDWQRMRQAALDASDLWVPLPNGSLVRAVACVHIPPADYDPAYLDRDRPRRIIFRVDPPPGSADGPLVSRCDLSTLRRDSGPRFRALIAAHSVAWRKGVTQVKHKGRWFWTGDSSKYHVLTREDRRRLAFGATDKGHRPRAEQDAAWEDLPNVEIVDRSTSNPDGKRAWLILPARAAEAVRRRTRREGDNRGIRR